MSLNLPPYNLFPVISNELVSLYQIDNECIKQIVSISFYDGVQASTIHEAIEMNERIKKDYCDGNSIHWAICENNTKKIIGTCGFYRGFTNETGEIGCVLLPEFQGKGFMTSALMLVIQFGINKIGLSKICAITSVENLKAILLLNRLKFEKIKEVEMDLVLFEYSN